MPTSAQRSRAGAGSQGESSGTGTEIGSGGPMRGLTCGELASGLDEPAHPMDRGDVGRAVQQHAPVGLSHPHLHMLGTVSVVVRASNTGTVAGNTRTRTRNTAVPRHPSKPTLTLIDPSTEDRRRLSNSRRITPSGVGLFWVRFF